MISKPLFLHFFFTFITLTSSSPSTPRNLVHFATTTIQKTSISLTQQLKNCTSNSPYSNFGRLFYKYPVQFLDSSFNSTVSFSTRFSFTIVPPPPPCVFFGEGIAFLIAAERDFLPHSVGCIGLPKSLEQSSRDSSFLAVEFDTNFDKDLGDINDNHVGINLDSIFSVASADLTSSGIDLKSGKRMTVWIEYGNSEKVIKISIGLNRTKPGSPILVAPIDLSKRFNRFMHVGFSAANGRGSGVHQINSWHFKTFKSVSTNIEAEVVGSKNCLICFPEHHGGEEFLRLLVWVVFMLFQMMLVFLIAHRS